MKTERKDLKNIFRIFRWKNLLTAVLAVALAAGCLGISASAAATALTDTDTVTEMGSSYYTTLEDSSGNKLEGNPSLTIYKYENIDNKTDSNTVDESKPIQGVEFEYAKIGNLYEITTSSETVMAYGIRTDVATAAGIANAADYTKTINNVEMSFYKKQEVINSAIQNTASTVFTSTENNNPIASLLTKGTTDEKGKIAATLDSTNKYGLYLVIESDVSNATNKDGKAISITKSQNPFVISLPTYTSGSWDETIDAKVKNSTDEAEVTKKIKKTDGTLVDTDTVAIGDTVTFQITSTVPYIQAGGESIKKYVLTDNISEGLTPPSNFENDITVSYKVEKDGDKDNAEYSGKENFAYITDYTVSSADYDSEKDDADAAYENGKTLTITFTAAGLAKLQNIAKETNDSNREITVTYSATVNDNAQIGPNRSKAAANSGNPNEVSLTYQVGGSAEMTSGPDKVTVFTFEIDVTKQLDGETPEEAGKSDNIGDIQFVLYKKVTDSTTNETSNVYYKFTQKKDKDEEPIAGVYYCTGEDNTTNTESKATTLIPTEDGSLSIKGLKAGTYYLKEIKTISGYNIIKDEIEFDLTAKTGTNAYVDASRTGNYLGTLTLEEGKDSEGKAIYDTDGVDSTVTINNTSGFKLPGTGGAGTWLFTIAGILVIFAGLLFFKVSGKRRRA